jgi:hypothetical protein
MKKNYPATREEYTTFFQRIRSKEIFELTGEDYTNLRTNLLAGLNEHIISMDLVADVAELVKLPLGTKNYKKDIDSTLDKVIKNIRERGQKGPKGSKYSVGNLVDPPPEKSKTRELKISSLREKYWKRYWEGADIRIYDKDFSKIIFEGTGYWENGSGCVKGTGKYIRQSLKLKPGLDMEKRDKGERNTWRSHILIE